MVPGLVILLCFLSALSRRPRFVATAAAAPTLVTSFPGFGGALPFRLETGYVSVDEENGAELFYYFIESEGDPSHDPILIWLTGGDRCSVLSALLFEIGPLKFIIEPYHGTLPRLRYHPYSWTKAASILFVDSPVGAGFSFSWNPEGYDVGEMSSSLQLKKFLNNWFSEHPNYLANPFYVAGDSYAGMYVPFLADKISQDIEAGLKPTLNLKGYLVGNPSAGDKIDAESRVPYLHGVGIISDQMYETIMEHCQGEDYSSPKKMLCVNALDRFNNLYNEISKPHILYKKCIYLSPMPNDETTERKILTEETGALKHPPPRPPIDCQNYGNYLSYFWANSNITREILGIKKGSKEWVRCHDSDLPFSKDIKSIIKYHRNVTSKGYRALIYSGDYDAAVPFLGTQSWVRSLNFSIVDEWRGLGIWTASLLGENFIFTITYTNNMTFATVKIFDACLMVSSNASSTSGMLMGFGVFMANCSIVHFSLNNRACQNCGPFWNGLLFPDPGGGHTAPEYQPERCHAMFTPWISNEPLCQS